MIYFSDRISTGKNHHIPNLITIGVIYSSIKKIKKKKLNRHTLPSSVKINYIKFIQPPF